MDNLTATPGTVAPGARANNLSALRSVLRGLNASAEHIEASAVISGDGRPIVTMLGDQTDPERFIAMCASLLSLANRTAQEIRRGRLRQLLLEGELGSVLLVQAGANAVLAVVVRPGGNLGMLFHEARKVARKAEVLMTPEP